MSASSKCSYPATITAAERKQQAKATGAAMVLIRCVHWMVKSGVAMMHLGSLIALLTAVACNLDLRNKYSHFRYFWGGLFAISEALLCSQLASIRESPYFGILVDSQNSRQRVSCVIASMRQFLLARLI